MYTKFKIEDSYIQYIYVVLRPESLYTDEELEKALNYYGARSFCVVEKRNSSIIMERKIINPDFKE
jgi:hypothetical protein